MKLRRALCGAFMRLLSPTVAICKRCGSEWRSEVGRVD